MLFEISHITAYTYPDRVFFEPHSFRFKPKSTPHSDVKRFHLNIEPRPSGQSEQIDIENNHLVLAWFDGMHKELQISSTCVIEVRDHNPLNFLVYPPDYLRIPFRYPQKTTQLLAPSLLAEKMQEATLEYSNNICTASQSQSVDFLLNLTSQIHKDFNLQVRETGNPNHPDITFNTKIGSCRDIAWMQIHMLRQLGIAARFVSGYYFVDIQNPEFELHAWIEAYLPGAGWVGLDPSHGIVAHVNHIPVASSAFHENTMPVSGTIRGDAQSALKHTLKISQVDTA